MASDQYNETNEFSHWEPTNYLDTHPLEQPGHDEEALKVYDDLISRNPTHILAYIMRGRTLRKLKRIEESQTSFIYAMNLIEQALNENPKNVQAYIYRADTLSLLKQKIEALAIYDQAIQLAPDNYEPYLNKGWIQIALRHYHEALTLLQRAHELQPGDADILWRMNIAYWEMGQYDKSLEMLERAINLDSTQSRFYGDLATTLYSLGRDEEGAKVSAQAEMIEKQSLAEALEWYRQTGLDNT
jgi:tetratricopeptide (TPR) repeat protein